MHVDSIKLCSVVCCSASLYFRSCSETWHLERQISMTSYEESGSALMCVKLAKHILYTASLRFCGSFLRGLQKHCEKHLKNVCLTQACRGTAGTAWPSVTPSLKLPALLRQVQYWDQAAFLRQVEDVSVPVASTAVPSSKWVQNCWHILRYSIEYNMKYSAVLLLETDSRPTRDLLKSWSNQMLNQTLSLRLAVLPEHVGGR